MADIKNQTFKSAEALASDIGSKLERLRLSRNITQTDLAINAGISERTLRRLESGDGATLDSLLRVLLALKIAQNLDLLVPDPRVRPIERVRTGGTERQRSRSAKSDQTPKQWQWGSPE
ncbi:helix-turn-helix transcriptional regulator [uncultured Tateyamaria sp.]|uniref:helix-turn-helix domain-containing protein n=1 Tax=uncultured Tateyamaria sp. TaxID=455651 RepID=UPI00262C7A3D|nr:helix-turn-helix transcriptional regulator [uncultured Tateyamaria sp.]